MFGGTSALAVTEAPAPEEVVAETVLPAEATLPAEEILPGEAELPAEENLAPEADVAPVPEESQGAPSVDSAERGGTALGEAAAAATYRVGVKIAIPAEMRSEVMFASLNNKQRLLGAYNAPGAISINLTLDPKTGVWSAGKVPPGEYRIWFTSGVHQLLPGKITVANADVPAASMAVSVTGQATLGVVIPTGAKNKITSIAFTNKATGNAVTVAKIPSGLGLVTDPMTDLSVAGPCQAGGTGMGYWCPVLPPGDYILSFGLNNGKTVYYNGKATQADSNNTGTTNKAQATTVKIAAKGSARVQSVDVQSHFAATPKPGAPAFTDVKRGAPFYADIRWLADAGITTGVKQKNGTYKFLPKDSVTREAMIAFLYRANGVKNYKPKGASPFVDVKKGDQFYTQIMWAYENKVTTGINLGNGKRKFDPKATITREAMAAFMYRQYSKQIPVGSNAAKFTDVPAKHKFAKEIKWMASNKITTGVKQKNGTVQFQPKGATSREATAAFLHRAELKKK